MKSSTTTIAVCTTKMGSENSELLAAAGRGDQLAWNSLIGHYDGLVRSVARSFRIGEADVEDAVQLTWIALFRHLTTIRDAERLGGWLSITAGRQALAILRSQHGAGSDPQLDAGSNLADPGDGPEIELVHRDSAHALWALVAELPPRQRRLLETLFYDDFRCYRDVATRCQLPIGSIGPVRARALLHLRQKLQERGLDSSDF